MIQRTFGYSLFEIKNQKKKYIYIHVIIIRNKIEREINLFEVKVLINYF